MKMKKTFITTVATAAVVGFAAIAAAQTMQGPAGGATKPEGGQVEQKGGAGAKEGGGGAMMHQQGGAQSGEKATRPSTDKAAQGTGSSAKPDQRTGQSAGQKDDMESQHGAQEERGTQQKGAQTEKSIQQKGAQTQGNTQFKGTQEERGEQRRGAQTESGKAGVNVNEHAQGGASSRGASVQLSQDQRSRIGSVIGKTSSTRASTNASFNVAVGDTVPRDVHVEVLPEDVVQIVPQYEGFEYIVVGDQILIVDPDSMEIVAVIEA